MDRDRALGEVPEMQKDNLNMVLALKMISVLWDATKKRTDMSLSKDKVLLQKAI